MRGYEWFADPEHAWEPFQPDDESPWNAQRVVHLHRRAGFGATWGQIERGVTDGFEDSLRRVLEGETHVPDGRPAEDFERLVAIMEDSARRRPSIERMQLLWLYRILFTPFPLAEKMTLTWHSHYATSNAKVDDPLRMLDQNLVQRELWRAPIRELHLAMLREPAMLDWLDGDQSTKGHPNENLAREFLELFALGEGNYSEQDVRETARALTGWREIPGTEERAMEFIASYHDAGPKTILGETGPWRETDVVRIVCRHPAAALHIARRLYRTFISDTDNPTDDQLEPLASAMRTADDVDVRKGIEVILRSRLFHSTACRGRRVKSPVEYVVGTLRSLEVFSPPPDLSETQAFLTRMGQRLFYPPSVAGWERGMSWLRGPTLIVRVNFAADFAEGSLGAGAKAFFESAAEGRLGGPRETREALKTMLLGTPLPEARWAKLVEQYRAGDGSVRDLMKFTAALLSLPEAQVC